MLPWDEKHDGVFKELEEHRVRLGEYAPRNRSLSSAVFVSLLILYALHLLALALVSSSVPPRSWQAWDLPVQALPSEARG